MKSILAAVVLALLAGFGQAPNGTISGVVRAKDGQPQVGLRVAAMIVPQPGADPDAASVLISLTQTDSSGRYRLENVPPGRYFILAGAVDAPTYYPGAASLNSATLVSLAAGAQLTSYDFIAVPAPPSRPVIGARPTRPVLVRLVTEDGSSLPGSPLFRVTYETGLALRQAFGGGPPRGTSVVFNLLDGPTRFSVEGLPVGYSLKSVSYGNVDVGLGPITVSPTSQGDVVITLSVTPPAAVRGSKVTGQVTNVAKEWSLRNRMVRLVSTARVGPTLETLLKPDGSFEFAKVPDGTYRVGLDNLPTATSDSVTVAGTDVFATTIDMRNIPFPEYPNSSYASVFNVGSSRTLSGVMTEAIQPIHPSAPYYYFRMDVKQEATGAVESWAVMLSLRKAESTVRLMETLKLSVGGPVKVIGTGSRDGTNRISVDSMPYANSRINDLVVPNLGAP